MSSRTIRSLSILLSISPVLCQYIPSSLRILEVAWRKASRMRNLHPSRDARCGGRSSFPFLSSSCALLREWAVEWGNWAAETSSVIFLSPVYVSGCFRSATMKLFVVVRLNSCVWKCKFLHGTNQHQYGVYHIQASCGVFSFTRASRSTFST